MLVSNTSSYSSLISPLQEMQCLRYKSAARLVVLETVADRSDCWTAANGSGRLLEWEMPCDCGLVE